MLALGFLLIGGVSAVQLRSQPNAQLGAQIGDLISAGVSQRDPSAFQNEFENSVMADVPTVQNDAVKQVAVAANNKAASMQAAAAAAESFLRAPVSPNVNLHIESGTSSASLRAAEARAARHELADLQNEEVRFKELYAKTLLRQNTRLEGALGAAGQRSASFLAGGPTRSAAENAGELASDVQREAKQINAMKAQISYFSKKIESGGYTARAAIAALTNIVSEPNAKLAMMASSLKSKLKKLMQKESTPDQLRIAAGSLITQMSNMPVSTEWADDAGSFGHVNVVLPNPDRVYAPDTEVLQLRAGAAPSDTTEGDYYQA